MTPQEVIQKFMAELNANNYTYDTGVGTKILDTAVRSSSNFTDVQAVRTQMLADQIAAEKLAVEEILGSSYAGKTMSEVPSSILSAKASTYDSTTKSNANLTADDYDYKLLDNMTVQEIINERKAYIFLEQFCGIQLNKNYFVGSDGYGADTFLLDILDAAGNVIDTVSLTSAAADNVDTGAITGSDANLTLKVGDVVNGSTLTASDLSTLATKYGSAASLSGDTLIIGTGVEKTETSIVPEDGDMYLFTAAGSAKNINTGSNGWVVNATTGNDTITSGGRDSINAGAGSDKIIANADEATITTGAGSDSVEISASVKSVTITDLNSYDTIKISGTFEVGNAQIENSMLVVTDKTGTRKIKFSDLTAAGNAKIGAQTISEWLSKSGFNISDLSSGDSASGDVASSDTSSGDVSDAGRVAIDPNYTPNIEVANFETVEETQEISSATEINLGDVTIASGTVKAGGATVGTVASVTPAVMNFTTRGLTVHVGNGTATSYNSLTNAQKMMVAALFKWWAGSCLELNEDSYDLGFTSDTAKVTDITLSFENLGSSTLAQVGSYYRDGDGQVYQLELQINKAYYNTFDPTNRNGESSSSGAGFLDRTLAHEFTHAVMSTNINNFKYLPQFIKEGMAELTHGIDDERGNEIFALAYNSSSLSSALNLSDTGTGTSIAYSGGYMFLRYFAHQAALQTLDNFAPGEITATVNLGTGNATYYISGNSATEIATTTANNISLGSASGSTYTIGNTGVNQKINTGDGAKNIVGVNHKTSVTGGAGNDTIQFIEGTFIDAGGGNNSIVGSGQFATIKAGTGDDSVLVDGSSNSIALGDGNNLASIGSEFSYDNTITAGAGNDTVSAKVAYNYRLNLGDGDNRISIAARDSTIQTGDGADFFTFIYNNDSDNVISLGAGNDSVVYLSTNNTIDMGAGDDSVGQSGGNNVLLYNADSGNDTVWFFQSSDKLVIAGDYATEQVLTYDGGQYVDISVSIKSGDSVTGTVLLKQALNSFTEAANIVTVETASAEEENPLLISLTAGDDDYINSLDGATILALAGNDSIINAGDNISISGGDDNDTIQNGTFPYIAGLRTDGGSNGTIDAGNGNDSVASSGDSVIINGGEGNDSITNWGRLVTLGGGDGNDELINYGASVTIDGGADGDNIYNSAVNVSINTGDGGDSILNHGDLVTIDGGSGDDSISLGSGATNNLITYTTGDGLDTVWGFNSTSTLSISGGTYSKEIVGSNVIVTVGDGKISLVGAASLDNVNISGVEQSSEPSLLISLTAGNDNYTNTLAGATIQALAGNDSIVNEYTATNVSIDGGAGDDSIDNVAMNVTVDGGDDNDVIQNYSDDVSINGGEGADTISNVVGTGNKLSGGAGNDSIVNRAIIVDEEDATDDLPAGFYVGESLTLDGGDGADIISNEGGSNISISGGIGNDSVYNVGSNVSIDAGAGDDTVTNEGNSTTIDGSAGDDLIDNIGASVSIDGGDDDDTIQNYGDEVSINGGEGADTISNVVGIGNKLSGGAGNDSIVNRAIIVNEEDATDDLPAGFYVGNSLTLDGGDGADTIVNEGGNNISIGGGIGNDSVYNVGSNVSIDGGEGNDSIDNYGDSVTIDGGAGIDKIRNWNSNVSINGGENNDSIYSSGSNVTIDGGDGADIVNHSTGSNVSVNLGDGDDSISISGASVTTDGGDGDDLIYNFGGTNVSIDGGANNDYIGNMGTNVTINGGAGNDSISLTTSSENNLIEYADGDGLDTVWGFNSTSTLSISGGTYSKETVGNNVIVTVGDGKISLVGAASLDNVNISGVEQSSEPSNPLLISLTEDADIYENTLDGATIQALGGNDTLYNYGSNVSIDAGAGNDSIYSENDSGVTINAGADNDSVISSSNNASIDGGNGNDSLGNAGNNSTIIAGMGNDTVINVGLNAVVELVEGNNIVKNYTAKNTTIYGGTGNDSVSSDLNQEVGTVYIYKGGYDTLAGMGDADTLVLPQGSRHEFGRSENGYTLITVKNADNIVLGTITLESLVGEINITNSAEGIRPVNVIDNKVDQSLVTGSAYKDWVENYVSNATVQTGNGKDTLYSGNDEVSVDANGRSPGQAVYNAVMDGGADDDLLHNTGSYNTLLGGEGDDYLENYNLYDLGGFKVVMDGGNGADFLFNAGGINSTLLGGDGNDSIFNSMSWYTTDTDYPYIGAHNASIDGGNGDDVIQNQHSDKVSINGGKGNDTINNDGGEEILFGYTSGDGNDTILGFNATSTLKIGNGTGFYSKETVNNDIVVTVGDGKVSLVGAATLASVNIEGVEYIPSIVTLTEGNDTYNNSRDDVTIQALGGNDSIKNDADEVFIYADEGNDTIINTGAYVEIDGGAGNDKISLGSGATNNLIQYAAGDGKDTVWGYGDDDTIKITDGSTVTASVKGNDVILTVGNGSITLKDAATGKHVNVVDANDETLIAQTFYADRIIDGNSATLTSAFKSKTFTADETINNVDGSSTTNKFTLTGGDEDDTLIGGKGANFINGGGGENILTGGKGNDTFVTGNGNDTITDYGVGTDKISLGADVTAFSIEDGNIVLNFDDETSLTIQNGDGKKINFVQNGKASTELFTANGRTNTQGTSITLASSIENYTASKAMVTIDGGLTNSVWIVGNTKANKIFGGAGDDTLNGGSGKDTLTGGDGSDIFVYESGKDVITDYVSDDDKISLSAAATSETVDKKGNVVLKFSSSNSLTIKAGDSSDGREITFVGEDGDTTKTYFSERIVGSDGVTLQSTFKDTTFTATNDLPLVDASAVKVKLTLTGGVEDNTLIGGTKNDQLNGGDGSDLLIGGKGNDTFVYSSGDDTIGDYDTKDRISLSSAMTNFSLENDDVIIGFDEGSLTIQDSAGKSVTFVETTGTKVTTSVNVFAANGIFNNKATSATAVTLAADTSSFNAASYSKLVSIDGGILSSDASIVGNAKNNLIYAGDAGTTINGGGGNDSLWGGDGSDTFIYASGGDKDVVYNFGDEDALQISGTFTATVKDNSIAFKVGSTANALTLKDYTATEFNINGDTYQISGSTLAKK